VFATWAILSATGVAFTGSGDRRKAYYGEWLATPRARTCRPGSARRSILTNIRGTRRGQAAVDEEAMPAAYGELAAFSNCSKHIPRDAGHRFTWNAASCGCSQTRTGKRTAKPRSRWRSDMVGQG